LGLIGKIHATLRAESPKVERPKAEGEDGRESPSEDGPGKSEYSPGAQLAPSGLKILLSEDNPVNQQVAMALLERWGHAVTVAANGLEALAALEADRFDMVIMDVQMPEMDGLEATRRIRLDDRFSSIPVVALSAHALQEERDRCTAAGMNDHLSKPFRPEDLQAIVEAWAGKGSRAAERDPVGGEAPVLLEIFRETMREAGIESIVDSVVSTYLGEIPQRMAALEMAVEEGDPAAVEREAHALRSGSISIRADHFGELLDAMERAAEERKLEKVNEFLPKVREEYEVVRGYLKEMGFQPE
jgi:CheY-like chemotaxis protein/HPt (histidine-containing phosphotransfer) domain-containing protein